MTPLPVLALAGLLCDERFWQNQVQALGADHPFTIVPSLAGDSVATLAEAALARAPAERFALAGFSLGGYVALEIMRRASERVAGLALVDTGARADSPQSIQWRKRAIAAAREPAATDDVFASFLPRIIHPSRVDDVDLRELLRSMGDVVGADGFARQQIAAMTRPDSLPTLRTIRCPTVVICGRQDQITPQELSEEMAAGIAGSRLVIVERSGHMAPLEQPAAVDEALRDWLASIR